MWAVKLPSQNLVGAKKLGGSWAACKCPIGEGRLELHFIIL
ncbi:hypothetical protein ACT7DG_09560 [Bacillus cereus]